MLKRILIVIAVVVLLVLGLALVPRLFPSWNSNYCTSRLPFAQHAMGMGSWGMIPLGGMGMFLMWLFPLGLLAMLALAIAWLINAANRPAAAPAPTCAQCGQAVQVNWQHCPHCGTTLWGQQSR